MILYTPNGAIDPDWHRQQLLLAYARERPDLVRETPKVEFDAWVTKTRAKFASSTEYRSREFESGFVAGVTGRNI